MYKITDLNIHKNKMPNPDDGELWALDSEFFGMDEDRLHRPHGTFACLTATGNGQDVYIIFDTSKIQAFLDTIQNKIWAIHNAQFDIIQLRRFANIPDRKKIWDTFLIEKIRFSGLYGSFSLGDCFRRYCNGYLAKEAREEFSDNAVMSEDMIWYACADPVATWMVAKKQREEIDEDDLRIWQYVERPFLWTLLDSKGLTFDTVSWMERANADKIRAEEVDASLPFNPRSSQQVKKYFQDTYKLNLKSSDEKTLAEVLTKHPDIEEVAKILESRGLTKAASTYGQKWVDAVEGDGRIYPAWKQIGAETGRMSSAGLGIQTIPHQENYRKCFVAAPNHVMVVADYKSQEPKILAHITQDKTLTQIFQSRTDVYISVGYEVFGEKFDKKDPRRQAMKSIILGVSYGMHETGLAKRLEVSTEEATELLNKFYKKFPNVRSWVNECTKWKPYATTIYGRKFWGNSYANGWERNYQNFPCQGSAGDCTKIAASKVRNKLGYNPFLIYMHDELCVEFPQDDFERGKKILVDVMEQTQNDMHPEIPGEVEVGFGDNWNCKP